MPIVDGLTSTKLIRSYEKTHPDHKLSPRAALNRRVPIIAVSASLVEKERRSYIDAGFDGWILKPIAFSRLTEIMNGLVHEDIRRNNLYGPGLWEYGGWFHEPEQDAFATDTRPSGQPPLNNPPGGSGPPEAVQKAAASDSPSVKEEETSEQSREQNRLIAEQAKNRPAT